MSLAEVDLANVFELQVYTDGACHPNPGAGGWGAVIVNPDTGKTLEMAGSERSETTNNRMEMLAVIEAAEFLLKRRGPMYLCIHTDSKYVFEGATAYIYNWKKRNWRLSNGDPVKNRDLWQRIEQVRSEHHIMRFNWIRGHNGTEHNERADALAVAARKALAEV
jgi:ribonuclease HI